MEFEFDDNLSAVRDLSESIFSRSPEWTACGK